MLVAVVLLTIHGFAASGYVAHQFGNPPELGPTWGLGLYPPYMWVKWAFLYYDFNPQVFEPVWISAIAVFVVVIFGSLLIVGMITRSPFAIEDAHGTARWITTVEELRDIGMVAPAPSILNQTPLRRASEHSNDNACIYLATVTDDDGTCHYIRSIGNEHCLTGAPTRTGKGVGPVLVNALSWSYALVLYDQKREMFHSSAGWRQRHIGPVYSWNPLGNDETYNSYNFLETIRLGTIYEVTDAMDLANLLIDPSSIGAAEWDHWKKTGFAFLQAVILYTCYLVERREQRCANLRDVYKVLNNPDEKGDVLYFKMLKNEFGRVDMAVGGPLPDRREALSRLRPGRNDTIAEGAAAMLNREPEERTSVHSTASSCLILYADPLVARNTSVSDFAIEDIWNGDKPGSLYLTVPPDQEAKFQPMLRMMLTLILRIAQRPELKYLQGRPQMPWRYRTLAMFDEFPTLGQIKEVETALARIAGYGVQLFLFIQDLPQLYDRYGQNQTILSGCQNKLLYAPNDEVTAKWLSGECGETTIVKHEVTVSGNRFGNTLNHVQIRGEEIKRDLITDQEARRLAPPEKDAEGRITKAGDVIILRTGYNPIFAQQLLYFLDEEFLNRQAVPFRPTRQLSAPPYIDLEVIDTIHVATPAEGEA